MAFSRNLLATQQSTAQHLNSLTSLPSFTIPHTAIRKLEALSAQKPCEPQSHFRSSPAPTFYPHRASSWLWALKSQCRSSLASSWPSLLSWPYGKWPSMPLGASDVCLPSFLQTMLMPCDSTKLSLRQLRARSMSDAASRVVALVLGQRLPGRRNKIVDKVDNHVLSKGVGGFHIVGLHDCLQS